MTGVGSVGSCAGDSRREGLMAVADDSPCDPVLAPWDSRSARVPDDPWPRLSPTESDLDRGGAFVRAACSCPRAGVDVRP